MKDVLEPRDRAILEAVKRKKTAIKSEIHVNLLEPFTLSNFYERFDVLEEKALLEFYHGRKHNYYRLTPKGRRLLRSA